MSKMLYILSFLFWAGAACAMGWTLILWAGGHNWAPATLMGVARMIFGWDLAGWALGLPFTWAARSAYLLSISSLAESLAWVGLILSAMGLLVEKLFRQ